MMRLWMLSYAKPSPIIGAGGLSFVAHATVIALAVVATLPSGSVPTDSIANRIYYIPPPNRPPAIAGGRPSLHYITLAEGLGSGPGPASIDARQPISAPEKSPEAGAKAVDSVTSRPGTGDTHTDSVFTILEVDTAVVRSQASAAPAYPLEMLQKRIEGSVTARYIVDTTGFADATSLEIIKSTHSAFEQSVRDALPYMRFSPAKIGPIKVRQLVEQSFTFKIAPPSIVGQKPE